MPMIGHYSQLVWGKTTHIGCGIIKYKSFGSYIIEFACNYRPGGNTSGESVCPTFQ